MFPLNHIDKQIQFTKRDPNEDTSKRDHKTDTCFPTVSLKNLLRVAFL